MPKLNQKGVATVFLVIGVIFILFAGLMIYVSVTPHEPSQGEWMNWKFKDTNPELNTIPQPSPIPPAVVVTHTDQKINTFTSTRYGYSINFPDSWKYSTNDESIEAYQNDDLEKTDALYMTVRVNALDLSTSKTVADDFEKDFARPVGDTFVEGVVNSKFIKIKNFEVDGYSGVVLKEYFTYEGPLYLQNYYIKLDDLTTLVINIQSHKEIVLAKNKVVIDQIINSLKIQPRVVLSSEWKLYENKKNGFSFKYPANWTVLDDQNTSDVSLHDPEMFGRFSISMQKGNYSDRCDGANLEESFFIGDQSVKLQDYCNKTDFQIQNQAGTKFTLSTVAWGLLAEDTIKKVLKTMTGLEVVR